MPSEWNRCVTRNSEEDMTNSKNIIGALCQKIGFLFLLVLCSGSFSVAQDFERYKPKSLSLSPPPTPQLRKVPIEGEGSDKVLVERLDAVKVVDSAEKVESQNSNADAKGVLLDFEDNSSLVHTDEFQRIIKGYIGGPLSLRRLNQMSRDIIQLYRDSDQPVVDVQIPEQRVTGGTVQIVIIESRIGEVVIESGPFFHPQILKKWIGSTHSGSRIYESSIVDDLFWLNQSPFRMVDVDLQPGSQEGTTDVIFKSNEVLPWRTYVGYEDTGVRSLDLERIYAGIIWGNVFGRDGMFSYQYTGNAELDKIHAHAVTWQKAFNRNWSMLTGASWAGFNPDVVGALFQNGESWQVTSQMTRHLEKNRYVDLGISAGFDFKSTNNNLEFGGVNVANSNADLVNLRMGYRGLTRNDYGEYFLFQNDFFIGPGTGFTSGHNSTAFNSIRPATSPNYMYDRVRMQGLFDMGDWQLVTRTVGQYAFDRLLFSETIGLGGFDSIRGYDQWVFSGDSGWVSSYELGPKPVDIGCEGDQMTFYGFFDIGKAYTRNTQPGEFDDLFLMSTGLGMRLTLNQNSSLRLDYGHGIEKAPGIVSRDRIHVGYIRQFGPRPTPGN